jgi:hypothetical protein
VQRGKAPPAPGEAAVVLAPPEPVTDSFDVQVVGDNPIIIGTPGYRIAILEFDLYNVVDQTVRLIDPGAAKPDLHGPLVNMPASIGFYLPYQEEPHWKLTFGSSFIVNLSAGRVTGFVKYRMLER